MAERMKVVIHPGETVMNQCCHAALLAEKEWDWVKAFLNRVQECLDIDDLFRVIAKEFEVTIVDD